jgi:hypothetical protein
MSAVPNTGAGTPELSVVVNIVDGGAALRRVLHAIASQHDPPAMQIVVPVDASIAEAAAVASSFPGVEVVELGSVSTRHSSASASGQHELYEQRRATGLRHARGALIALLEDRAAPRPDWARRLVEQHRQLPHAVIGGAVECASTDLLNWAFWACDYSRYALPFASGPRDWLSDVNVSYKRRALDATRDVWQDRYNEARLHRALADRGETLFLTNDAVVEFKAAYRSLGPLLAERVQWGRVFGAARAADLSASQRVRLLAAGPLLPVVLLLRHAATQRRLGNGRRFARALPLVLSMLTAWTVGEVQGYFTQR